MENLAYAILVLLLATPGIYIFCRRFKITFPQNHKAQAELVHKSSDFGPYNWQGDRFSAWQNLQHGNHVQVYRGAISVLIMSDNNPEQLNFVVGACGKHSHGIRIQHPDAAIIEAERRLGGTNFSYKVLTANMLNEQIWG